MVDSSEFLREQDSFNHGYPCGPNNPCGTVAQQTCDDSALGSKQCDGWMYSDPSTLVSGDFLANNALSFDNDWSKGHSGSAVYTPVGTNLYAAMTLVPGGLAGQRSSPIFGLLGLPFRGSGSC